MIQNHTIFHEINDYVYCLLTQFTYQCALVFAHSVEQRTCDRRVEGSSSNKDGTFFPWCLIQDIAGTCEGAGSSLC